jgi:hypothetical protein
LRDWGFWDWGGFTVLWIAVAASAIDQALKLMPELAAHIEPDNPKTRLVFRSVLAFAPLVFLSVATLILLGRATDILGSKSKDIIQGKPVLTIDSPFGGDDSTYEGRPLGMAWASAMLHTHNAAAPPTNTMLLRIDGIEVWGKNLGPEQPRLKNATMISGIDGTEINMKIGDNVNGLFDPSEASAAPVGALFEAVAVFDEHNRGVGESGLSTSDFIAKWGVFRVTITYEGETLHHDYNREWVSNAIAAMDPRLGPHISKRQP